MLPDDDGSFADAKLNRSIFPASLAIQILIIFVITAFAISWFGFQSLYVNFDVLKSVRGHVQVILWLFAAAVATIVVIASTENIDERLRYLTEQLQKHYCIAGLAISAACLVAILLCVAALRAFPNSGDEFAYLFQAKTYLAGRLWNPLQPLHEWFSTSHIVEKDGKWLGYYPPGWSSIFVVAELVRMPAYFVCPICAVFLIIIFARFSCAISGPLGAVVGAALLALCPFYVLNGASYFNHIPTALFGICFALFGFRYLKAPTVRSAMVAGAALGVVGTIRPYSAVLFALAYALEFLVRGRREHYRLAIWAVIGGAPFLAGLMYYNYQITGNPLLFVTSWGYPGMKLGFHSVDDYGAEADLWDTARMVVRRWVELMEWTSPLVPVIYIFAIFRKIATRTVRFFDLVFPVFMLGYLLFPTLGGNRYGPRYYFEAYPFLVLTIVSATVPCLQRWNNEIKSRLVAIALGTHVVLAATNVPILVYETSRIVNERMEIFDLVDGFKSSNAIVLIRSPSGVIWPMPPHDLTRNTINLDGDVLFALDLDGRREELLSAFPDRKLYVYERSAEIGPGMADHLVQVK